MRKTHLELEPFSVPNDQIEAEGGRFSSFSFLPLTSVMLSFRLDEWKLMKSAPRGRLHPVTVELGMLFTNTVS